MHGIRIHRKSYEQVRKTIPNEIDEFLFIFEPVLPFFKDQYWIIDGGAFQWPDYWDDQSEYDQNKKRFISGPLKSVDDLIKPVQGYPDTFFAAPDIFPKYAKYLYGFDCTFFGFPKELKFPEYWLKEYYNVKDRKEFVCSTTSFFFYDLDGAFWEFFSQKKMVVETIKSQTKIHACFDLKEDNLMWYQ